jgi:hypothetical protein
MVETDDDITSEASIIDVEGVGPVIFFASGSMGYAIEADGAQYTDLEDNGAEISSSITFANVGGTDYAMFGDESGKAHMYNISDGESYSNFPISYSFPFKGSPTILDTDADGDLELLLGSTQNLTSIDIKASGTNEGYWNTHRANMQRTGHYISSVDALGIDGDIIAYEFKLYEAYPNPFNPSTTISYDLPLSSLVSLSIYDIAGRLVKTLDKGFKGVGNHTVVWDGKDNFGNTVSNGIYVYKLISNKNNSISKKITFMK